MQYAHVRIAPISQRFIAALSVLEFKKNNKFLDSATPASNLWRNPLFTAGNAFIYRKLQTLS
jgi:hypothetical protein